MIDEKKLIEESTWYPDKYFAVSDSDHYRNGWNDCNRDWLKRFKELSLETKTSDWIPCSERLPEEEYDEYLCCNSKGDMIVGFPFECEESDSGFSAENDNHYMYEVIAWMPLPEPYKEKEK